MQLLNTHFRVKILLNSAHAIEASRANFNENKGNNIHWQSLIL